jgi:predicted transcriptional regulator
MRNMARRSRRVIGYALGSLCAEAHLDDVAGWYYLLTTSPRRQTLSATSLKLPGPLKRQIAQLAASAGQTPHAYMIDVLSQEAKRAELRAQFAADAADSEREALDSGKAHSLDAAFNYLDARAAGKKVRSPRARAWRASK